MSKLLYKITKYRYCTTLEEVFSTERSMANLNTKWYFIFPDHRGEQIHLSKVEQIMFHATSKGSSPSPNHGGF